MVDDDNHKTSLVFAALRLHAFLRYLLCSDAKVLFGDQ